MWRIIFCIFFFNFSSCLLHAQDSIPAYPEERLFQRVKNDVLITGNTIIKAYKRPFQWKKKEWLMSGSLLALSAASSLIDRPIYAYFEEHSGKNPVVARIASVGDFLGQPEHNYPFMMTIWGLGIITKNEWLRDTGILLTASITSSGLVQTTLKEIVGRARPATGKGPYAFKPFGGRAYHSFPSGHTMLALASGYILAHQITTKPLRFIVFAIPVITGFSRLHDGAHFFSDLILGSAIGIAFAEAVLNLYPKIKTEQRSKISLIPTMKGFKLAYRF